MKTFRCSETKVAFNYRRTNTYNALHSHMILISNLMIEDFMLEMRMVNQYNLEKLQELNENLIFFGTN